MEIRNSRVLMLGGSGLVGRALARRMLSHEPRRLAITALRQQDAEKARTWFPEDVLGATELALHWGNMFQAAELKDVPRAEIIADAEKRRRLLDDLYGPLDAERLERSYLYSLIKSEQPDIVIDCVNTATSIAYQDVFSSVAQLRASDHDGEGVGERIEQHLASVYLPQLIRHVRILIRALRAVGSSFYLKVGTSGTGGMGLNVPFTHSEERPSNMLLAKASVAGAHSLLLFLMGRTPDGPAVKEIKPTAAIAWKGIASGPIKRRGEPLGRFDATGPVSLEAAFASDATAWRKLDGHLEAVFLDAGENGYFSRDEFEAISSLGMMELVTPEEIADAAVREIRGYPTGLDVVSALDGASMGPTYRGGVLREVALRRMEELESQFGSRSVAFEILGPPRVSKLLFEGHLLELLYGTLTQAAELDPDGTAVQAQSLIQGNDRLRVSMLSVGIPILCADGQHLLRGPEVKVKPRPGVPAGDRAATRGWVDLRASNWVIWRQRVQDYLAEICKEPGPDVGSVADIDATGRSDTIRPGTLVAWILKREEGGARLKR